MTERLADIGARIAGVHQLDAVVNAMRGIAASRVQQARGQLNAVDRYAAIIEAAIGRVLAMLPAAAPTKQPQRPAIVVFCAEQGFAGGFSERVLDAVGPDLARSDVFLIGTRGAVAASERGVATVWQHAMPSHSAVIPKLADAITQAVYARIAKGQLHGLAVVFMQWLPGRGATHQRQNLLPLDVSTFRCAPQANPPLLYLAPADLLGELTQDYLHALLCKAALHAFAAENETRMQTMASAHTQIGRQLETLQSTQRLVRQEEITEEIIELAAGETATRPGVL